MSDQSPSELLAARQAYFDAAESAIAALDAAVRGLRDNRAALNKLASAILDAGTGSGWQRHVEFRDHEGRVDNLLRARVAAAPGLAVLASDTRFSLADLGSHGAAHTDALRRMLGVSA